MSVAQILGLLLQGSSTNWFGLGCPAHCSGSLLVLGLSFLAGACLGVLLALWFFRAYLFLPAVQPVFAPDPTPDSTSPVPRPRSLRLRGYLHE